MARLLPFLSRRGARFPLRVLELPSGPGRGAPPVRYVIGAHREGGEPLELDPPEPLEGTAIPAIAVDDHRALWNLLAEATVGRPPTWVGEGDARIWTMEDAELRNRAEELLEDAEVRPLAVDSEERPWAVVPLSDPSLRFRPIHRAVHGLERFDEATFLQLVAGYARLYDLASPLTSERGREAALSRLASLATGYHAVLAVLRGGRGKVLRFRQALELSTIPAAPRSPTLRALDLALLNALVLRTVLGVHGAESPGHRNVAHVASLEELVEGVERGAFQAGFALNPPPAWEVRAVIEAGERLPARTLQLDPPPPVGAPYEP